MAKDDFICAICKEVKSAGLFNSKERFECPKHGTICEDCTDKNLITSDKCKKCGKKVIEFKWNSQKKEWLQS